MKIIGPDNKEISYMAVIAKYFRMAHESVSDIGQQIRALTPSDKEELALGAAKELGYTVLPD